MAEPANPSSPPASTPAAPPQPGSAPPAQPLPTALGGTGAAAARPDYIEERHWDAATGTVKVEDLGKSYREARAAISKGVDGYKAELLKGRPEKPEAYTFKAPDKGPLAERLAKSGLVILADNPGADFKPEPGKQYFALKADDPMLAYWRKTAFDAGMSQDQFMEGIATYAETLAAKAPTEQQRAEAIAATFKALGENGQQRAAHLWGQVQAKLSPEHAAALDEAIQTPEQIMALEALMEKMGEPRFSPAIGASPAQPDSGAMLLEAKRIQGEPDYWSNMEKQKRVSEIYQKVYPGPSQGVTPGSKLGPSAGRAA